MKKLDPNLIILINLNFELVSTITTNGLFKLPTYFLTIVVKKISSIFFCLLFAKLLKIYKIRFRENQKNKKDVTNLLQDNGG